MRRPIKDFFNTAPTRVTLEYTIERDDRGDFTTFEALDVYITARDDDITGPTNRENVDIKNRGEDQEFAIVERITVTERFTEDYLENIKSWVADELSIDEESISYEISVVTESGG